LALYPAWYNDLSDLAPQDIGQTDFVFSRTDESSPLSAELEAFLSTGSPPVAFTFGTGVAHIRSALEKAVEVLSQLGLRGLFITRFTQNLPDTLGNAMVVPYADFAALLPRVSLLVHHGGIGTAAQAIRAGIPQLIIPIAFDQPDNAYRLKTLGLAEFLPNHDFQAPALKEAISQALSRVDRQYLAHLRQSMRQTDGVALAADYCATFFATRTVPQRTAA
jgi:rhamnosyltransferase subunit B